MKHIDIELVVTEQHCRRGRHDHDAELPQCDVIERRCDLKVYGIGNACMHAILVLTIGQAVASLFYVCFVLSDWCGLMWVNVRNSLHTACTWTMSNVNASLTAASLHIYTMRRRGCHCVR